MAKRELLAFEAPTAKSPPGGGSIYPATPRGAGLGSTAANGGMVAVTGTSVAWRTVIIASLVVAGTATVSVGIAAAVVLTNTSDRDKPPETDPPVETEGWGTWSEWGSCSLSCGLGAKTRRRQCYEPAELCVGNDVQADDCYLMSCPKREYGVWGSWGGWSPCPVSCGGGTQERIRECVKDKDDQQDCSGNGRMQRPCNGWACPSCDRVCPDGGRVIRPNCLRCVCLGQVYQGIVTTEYNLPLEGVRITDAVLPPVDLARSDANGRFTIYGACAGIDLLFRKGGYHNKRKPLVIKKFPQHTQMEKLVDIRISTQPEHRVRLTGENVTFCCDAYGRSNNHQYFEWFFESQLIDPSVYNYGNTLTITGLTKHQHEGLYKCRASNDHSAIFSDDAILQIEDHTKSFCTREPKKNVVMLPDGCEHNGLSTLDQGQCGRNRCRPSGQNDSAQCSDEETYCCGPSAYNKVQLNCRGYSMNYYLVRECSCRPCKQQKVFITGQVYDAETKLPVSLVTVKVNGTTLARTNAAGMFTIRISYRTKDVPIFIQDNLGRYSSTMRTEHIPAFLEGMVYIAIPLWKYGKEMAISGSTTNVIKLARPGNDPYAQLKIPPSSLYTVRGIKYQALAYVKTAAMDVKLFKDFFSSPADLDFLDSEGNIQKKQMLGLFSLNFYSRYRGVPLQVSQELEVSMDISNTITAETDNINIWALDPLAGHWKSIGTMTSTKQFNSTNQFSSPFTGRFHYYPWNTWIGIAYDVKNICHSKIQVYKTNHFNQEEQIKGVHVTMVSTRPDGTVAEVSNIRTSTDLNDNNGYCLAHICDVTEPRDDFVGYFLVEYPQLYPTRGSMITTQQLHAACPSRSHDGGHIDGLSDDLVDDLNYQCLVDEDGNQGAKVNVDLVSVDKYGPFYEKNGYNNDLRGWAYAEDCSYAGYKGFKENRFPFYENNVNTMPNDLCDVKSIPVEEMEFGQTENQNYQAWFSESADDIYQSCFIKVLVTNWRKQPMQAQSIIGNFSLSDTLLAGRTAYGVTHSCANSNEEALCMEFKHPGTVSNGKHGQMIDETLLKIQAVEKLKVDDTPKCSPTRVRKCLTKGYGHKVRVVADEINVFSLYVNTDMSAASSDIGIYCTSSSSVESKEAARLQALQACQRGNDVISRPECNDKDSDDPEKIGWAVHFSCL